MKSLERFLEIEKIKNLRVLYSHYFDSRDLDRLMVLTGLTDVFSRRQGRPCNSAAVRCRKRERGSSRAAVERSS